jgi:hypothetical protein
MTSYQNNAPTMTPQEIALWEQRVTSGRLFGTGDGPRPYNMPPSDIQHSNYVYQYYRCRCDVCRSAHRAYQAAYYARKKQEAAK